MKISQNRSISLLSTLLTATFKVCTVRVMHFAITENYVRDVGDIIVTINLQIASYSFHLELDCEF